MRFFQKAPSAVYELNDEQVERWRDGDDSVWNEDSKGRPLSLRALARCERQERREERELDRGLEAGS